MTNKNTEIIKNISIKGLFIAVFGVIMLCMNFSVNSASATTYSNSYPYSYNAPYNYRVSGNYQPNNYFGNNYGYGNYYGYANQNYPSNLTCPTGFNLTFLNSQYICIMRVGGGNTSYYGNNYNNYGNYNYGYYNNKYSNDDDLDGDEASLENFDISEGDDADDLEEGDNNKEIVEFEFDVEDGDVKVERVDLNFKYTGRSNGEDNPWDVFERAVLFADGDEVGEIDAEDRDEWTRDGTNTYRLRFDDMNYRVRENDNVVFTLEVDIARNSNSSRNSNTAYDIFVPDDGIRARDGRNRNHEIGDDGEKIRITIDNL